MNITCNSLRSIIKSNCFTIFRSNRNTYKFLNWFNINSIFFFSIFYFKFFKISSNFVLALKILPLSSIRLPSLSTVYLLSPSSIIVPSSKPCSASASFALSLGLPPVEDEDWLSLLALESLFPSPLPLLVISSIELPSASNCPVLPVSRSVMSSVGFHHH